MCLSDESTSSKVRQFFNNLVRSGSLASGFPEWMLDLVTRSLASVSLGLRTLLAASEVPVISSEIIRHVIGTHA